MAPNRPRPSPLLRPHLTHLKSPLHPLLSITTGAPHPSFPVTLLHYHLLTETQLDELAHYYHQRTPSAWSLLYPEPVVARWWAKETSRAPTASSQDTLDGTTAGSSEEPALTGMDMTGRIGIRGGTSVGIEEKRRRFGRFVGLRGCESPAVEGATEWGDEEMERWVRSRIEAGMRAEREREEGRRKGLW